MTLSVAQDAVRRGNLFLAQSLASNMLRDDPLDLQARHILALTSFPGAFEAVGDALAELVEMRAGTSEIYQYAIAKLLEDQAIGEDQTRWLMALAGEILYVTQSELRVRFQPFNDQAVRQLIFREIIRLYQPKAIYETGTQFATTTEFMARHGGGCLVYTTEYVYMLHIYAACRIRDVAKTEPSVASRIGLFHGDTVAFLDSAITDPTPERVFFYLDAHGMDMDAHVPLVDECKLIAGHCRQAAIMIDDIQIPDDQQYISPPGQAMAIEGLAEAWLLFDAAFVPTKDLAETGARRGSVMFSTDPETSAILDTMPQLRRFTLAG